VPRRATIQPRPLEPDPVHSSRLVAQVINKVMTDGKKSTAESIVYRALDRVGEQTGKPPVEVREKQMHDKLAAEILDALNQQGGAFKRKDDLYRMAQANKAFAHYRW
jgi:small subunit ribosomal protein S7